MKDRPLLDALRDVVKPKELAIALWALVKKGDLSAIKYVYDRELGMPTQRHEVDIEAVRDRAREVAEKLGLDVDEVMAEAERAIAASR